MRRLFIAALAFALSVCDAEAFWQSRDANYNIAIGAGGPVSCAQANTYLARTVGGNEGGNATPITTLICGLVTDGVITGNLSTTGCGPTPNSLDAFYVYAQQNATDAKLNLCSTSFTTTLGGTPTFTAFRGYSGFNVGGPSLNTNFNSTTATSPNFTQDAASFGFWAVAATLEGVGQMGTHNTGSVGESHIFDNYTGNLFYARVTNGTTGSVPNPGSKGLFVAERPSSTNVIPYWDGIAQATQTGASQAPYNGVFTVGVAGTGGGSVQQIAEAHIGGPLGATLNLAFYVRLRTYMSTVGVP